MLQKKRGIGYDTRQKTIEVITKWVMWHATHPLCAMQSIHFSDSTEPVFFLSTIGMRMRNFIAIPYFQYATPLAAQRYNNTVVLMFGCVMIWVAISQYSTIMPAYLHNRIVGVYNLLPNQLPAGTNPIKQLGLLVSGQDNEVYLTEIDGNNQAPQQGQQPVGEGGGNGAGGGNGGGGAVALAVGGRGANAGLLEAIVAHLEMIQ
jgi:hypothetical protein